MPSLAGLKTYLNITGTDQDAVLQIILDGAISTTETLSGRLLSARDKEILYNGNAQQQIVLQDVPLNTLTSFARNDGTIETPVWTEIDTNDFVVDFDAGIIYLKPVLQRGLQNYRIQCNVGYVTAPSDLTMAVYMLSGGMYSKRASQGITSETVDGDRIDYGSAMTTEINNILFSYRDMF